MKKKYLRYLALLLVLLSGLPYAPVGRVAFGQGANSTLAGPTSPADPTAVFLPLLSTGAAPIVIGDGIVVDHTSIALFERIPSRYLTAARELRMLFSDRSVGQNISESLDCLAASSWTTSPANCRNDYIDANWNWKTFTEADLNLGTVPDRIYFPASSTTYNRSNWTYVYRQGEWSDLTGDFIQTLAPSYLSSKDVLTYQFSYLNVIETSNIADPAAGFFANNPNKNDIYDLEAYISQHPDKIFIFWTTSLGRGIGTQVSTDFNQQMRQYAASHYKILFDVADIEAHTDLGAACHDNRDGVQYCNATTCENLPDDGLNLPAICQDYTTETEGGHLGAVSAGKIQLAKAFWVLMARIAGWDGVSP